MKLLSVNELADLTSKQRATINRRIAHLVRKKQGKNVLIPSDLALESIYKVDRAKLAQVKRGDRARREKAEADLAEIRLGKETETLGLLSQLENIWADGIEQGVTAIEKLKALDATAKDAVFAALRNIRLRVKDHAPAD